jgi:hypothetical protein
MNYHIFLPNGEELTYQNEDLYLFKWKNQEFYLKYDNENVMVVMFPPIIPQLSKVSFANFSSYAANSGIWLRKWVE